MLKANSRLKKLILSSNLLDDDAVRILADGISVNESLQTLVGLARFRPVVVGLLQAMLVLTKVASFPTTTQLIAANPFTNRGAHYLTEKLCSEDSHLRVLDVHNSEMSPDFESSVRLKPRFGFCFHGLGLLSFLRPRPCLIQPRSKLILLQHST